MLKFEYRWAEAILESYALPDSEGLAPEPGEVDWLDKLKRWVLISGPKAALGVRAAVWMLAFAPLWAMGRFRMFGSLSVAERCALLGRLLGHRWFMVRELTMLMKVIAAMAMMSMPSIVARSRYYARNSEPNVDQSGERYRLQLISSNEAAL